MRGHFQFVGTDPALEAAGKAYYEYRAALMVNNNEGMTKIYHRFHDLYEIDPAHHRTARAARRMDRAGVRDEALARLLALNAARAGAEAGPRYRQIAPCRRRRHSRQ